MNKPKIDKIDQQQAKPIDALFVGDAVRSFVNTTLLVIDPPWLHVAITFSVCQAVALMT